MNNIVKGLKYDVSTNANFSQLVQQILTLEKATFSLRNAYFFEKMQQLKSSIKASERVTECVLHNVQTGFP